MFPCLLGLLVISLLITLEVELLHGGEAGLWLGHLLLKGRLLVLHLDIGRQSGNVWVMKEVQGVVILIVFFLVLCVS